MYMHKGYMFGHLTFEHFPPEGTSFLVIYNNSYSLLPPVFISTGCFTVFVKFREVNNNCELGRHLKMISRGRKMLLLLQSKDLQSKFSSSFEYSLILLFCSINTEIFVCSSKRKPYKR